jgi:hypothetical protein
MGKWKYRVSAVGGYIGSQQLKLAFFGIKLQK